MEGRMRRSNIQILNVPETPGSSTPTAVSKLPRETVKPRVIVAKVHYYQDCVDILRQSRPLRFKRIDISIFLDYPLSVVQARSAFNEVRRLLRGRDGVKYGLLYPARLRITCNGTEKQFQNPGEAMTYAKTRILLNPQKD